MARGWDRDDERTDRPSGTGVSAGAARERRPPQEPPSRGFRLPTGRRREAVRTHGRRYDLRDTESRTLEIVGTFRTVFTRDLAVEPYAQDRRRLAHDLDSLAEQGLVQRRTLTRNSRGEPLEAVALTHDGQALLEARRAPTRDGDREPPQVVYAGFVRPSELLHDATLYRVYLVERHGLAQEGRTVRRVVLDHELKAHLYRPLNGQRFASTAERDARLAELAAAQHLPIVDGHVQFPDLRLEIETASGDRTRVDVELATEAYRSSQLRAKTRAGFAVYRAVGVGSGRAILGSGGSGGGSRANHDRDHLSHLFSL